jgi:hypothetical protein
MFKLIFPLALSFIVLGCGERAPQPRFEALARGLADAWQPLSHDLRLEIHAENDGERVIMRCDLKNVSAKAIEVDASTLPWNNADLFSVNAVGADGKVKLQQPRPPPVEIARLSARRAPMSIASGESLGGWFDLEIMPIKGLPRNENWILLWSYGLLRDWRSDAQYMLNGITLVNAKSQTLAAVPQTTPDSSVSGTNVPTANGKPVLGSGPNRKPPSALDLRNAPDTVVIESSVIRLQISPWVNRMPMATSRDPNTGLSKPDSRPMRISFRLLSEKGTPVPSTLRVDRIWIIQDDEVWETNAIDEPFAASNRSSGTSREFLVDEGPTWQSMVPIDAVIRLIDQKGSAYLLAVRHQKISSVE